MGADVSFVEVPRWNTRGTVQHVANPYQRRGSGGYAWYLRTS